MNKVEYRQKKVEAIRLKKRQPLSYRLTKNYGISHGTKKHMFESIGLNCRICISGFRKKHRNEVKSVCRLFFVGGLLKKHVKESMIYQIKIKSYRGSRHRSNYPSRGQRTHTNGKTKKKLEHQYRY